MAYIESKTIPQDILVIIGKFLPYKTIHILNQTKSSFFCKDSRIHKEFFDEHYSDVNKHYTITDNKKELEKIYQYKTMADYACSEGYQTLLEEYKNKPSEDAMKSAYKNGHLDTIEYLHKTYYPNNNFDNHLTTCRLTCFTIIVIFIMGLFAGFYFGIGIPLIADIKDSTFFLLVIFPYIIVGTFIFAGIFAIAFIFYSCIFYKRNPWTISKDSVHRRLLDKV